VPLQPYYRNKFGYKKGAFSAAERFYESEISLPIHPKMTKSDQSLVIKSLKKALE